MSDHLLFIDIESKANSSTPAEPLWTRSDNSFRFHFFPETSSGDRTEPATRQLSFTNQGSAFAVNFQIPPVTPVEDMETAETPDRSQPCIQEEKRDTNSGPSVQCKAKKKKKKSGKKNASDGTESQQKPTEGSRGNEDTELSAEEQLNRELDWCTEQLELGMRSQKCTPKQKDEASHALKTLRSSKAPLVKKRQVMRAMTGDYRKQMQEEKSKQFKLIQSETASAHVKVVSDSPKKSVFHRKAEVKGQSLAAEESQQQTEVLTPQAQEETPAFVFSPSKEAFRFNFL